MDFELQLVGYNDQLRSRAYFLTRSKEKAHDLVQDTFLAALRFREHYTPGTNMLHWLLSILKNLFINDRVRAKSPKHRLTAETPLPKPTKALAESNIGVKQIYGEVERLPAKLREAMRLYLNGVDGQTGSEELGITHGTFKVRVFFAKKQLVQKLERW